jgi:ribosome-binding factor A
MTRQHGTEPSQRQLRVGEEIRHMLAQILARGALRDPDLFDVTITVTEVRMSPDLRHATAFVTPLGGADMERVVAALKRAAPFLQRQVGRELRLRFTPALAFEADRSFDEASRIDRLLRGLDGDGTGGNDGA